MSVSAGNRNISLYKSFIFTALMRILLIASLLAFFLPETLQAQFSSDACVDSLLINTAPCSGTPYQPLCGCDNVSYRNECEARAKGVQQWTEGPCETMDFDILPNPLYAAEGKFYIYTRESTDVQVWIFDLYYNEKYYRRYPSVPAYMVFDNTMDVRGWGNGVYFVLVEAAGNYKVKRILVNQLP